LEVQVLWIIWITKKDNLLEEFKKEAVEYSLSSGKTAEEVARDLGIPHHNLDRWRAQYRKRGELAFPGHGKENLTPQEEKLRKLQKELTDTQIERDILKKALAIFTKKS
jgi:transposase